MCSHSLYDTSAGSAWAEKEQKLEQQPRKGTYYSFFSSEMLAYCSSIILNPLAT